MLCPPQPLRFWITPACAGKRMKSGSSWMNWWDHPRVCGEKDKAAEKAQHLRGSPPRVRGKAVHHKHRHSPGRITPACAGKRKRPKRWVRPPKDHPRVCGEKRFASASLDAYWGSPPRMRGKGSHLHSVWESFGITPACAGKSGSAAWHRWACRDHPRVCGEKHLLRCAVLDLEGSPPRVRGKGYDVVGRLGGVRITPACAGKRSIWRPGSAGCGDHPRVCGEK